MALSHPYYLNAAVFVASQLPVDQVIARFGDEGRLCLALREEPDGGRLAREAGCLSRLVRWRGGSAIPAERSWVARSPRFAALLLRIEPSSRTNETYELESTFDWELRIEEKVTPLDADNREGFEELLLALAEDWIALESTVRLQIYDDDHESLVFEYPSRSAT